MVKAREIETEDGVQDKVISEKYDRMSQNNSYWRKTVTNKLINLGIDHGTALEIGPGPGHVGLDWLNKTKKTRLVGIDISAPMVALAKKNAESMGLSKRTDFVNCDAAEIPFKEKTFDVVFASASLHEWANPKKVFDGIHRVLKPGGKYFIIDLRRDMNALIKFYISLQIKDKELKPGLYASINASYTLGEVQEIISKTDLRDATVKKTFFGIEIAGKK